jgi:hypothetical protein
MEEYKREEINALEADPNWTLEEKELAKEANEIANQINMTTKDIEWVRDRAKEHMAGYDMATDKEAHDKITRNYSSRLKLDIKELVKLREKSDDICKRVNKYYEEKERKG